MNESRRSSGFQDWTAQFWPILGQFGSVLINRSRFGQKRSNGFDKIENESRDDRYMVLMNVHE